MKDIKVSSMTNESSGRDIANQFIIHTKKGTYFQSYNKIIVFEPAGYGKKIQLDKSSWDYSVTTGKYRNQFLGEGIKETRKKIENGTYELVDLN